MKVNRMIIHLGLLSLGVPAAWGTAVIDTYPEPSPYPGQNYFTDGYRYVAQTFVPPPGNPVLLSWEFELDARYGQSGSAQFSIFEWAGGLPSGPSLFTATVPWPQIVTDPVVSGINLTLTPGQRYGAVIDLLGYSHSSVLFGPDLYPGGDGFWNNGMGWSDFPQYDLTFRAEFAAVPEPPPYALMLFFLGVTTFGRVCGRATPRPTNGLSQ
jgi:hypothetical protein